MIYIEREISNKSAKKISENLQVSHINHRNNSWISITDNCTNPFEFRG